jgi:hypothetical protein
VMYHRDLKPIQTDAIADPEGGRSSRITAINAIHQSNSMESHNSCLLTTKLNGNPFSRRILVQNNRDQDTHYRPLFVIVHPDATVLVGKPVCHCSNTPSCSYHNYRLFQCCGVFQNGIVLQFGTRRGIIKGTRRHRRRYCPSS